MALHALSLLINQHQAFMRSGMQMCVIAVGPIFQGIFALIILALSAKFL